MHLADDIATLSDLRGRGIRDAEIRTALRRGDLIRVRPGVVARPDAHPDILVAARLGGRLAGASAARRHGLWVPPGVRLCVEVPRGVHLPDRGDRRGVLLVRGPAGPSRYGVSSVEELIPQVIRTEPTPLAIAILDSIPRRTALTRADLEFAASGLPRRLRRLLALVDPRAEGGSESIVRVMLALVGIRASPQVRVPFTDLDRLDLVVGDRLVLECDSRAHHSTPEELDRDNARDLALTALGFVVLRIRYRSLLTDPDGVLAAVRRLVDAGVHLDRSAPGRLDTPVRRRRVEPSRCPAGEERGDLSRYPEVREF